MHVDLPTRGAGDVSFEVVHVLGGLDVDFTVVSHRVGVLRLGLGLGGWDWM